MNLKDEAIKQFNQIKAYNEAADKMRLRLLNRIARLIVFTSFFIKTKKNPRTHWGKGRSQ